MATDSESGQDKLVTALLQMAQSKHSSSLPVTAIVLSALALGVSGLALYSAMDRGYTQLARQQASAVPATATFSQSPGTEIAPTFVAPTREATVVGAAPVPQGASSGANVRIAQSTNGSIYAFDPDSGLAFRFDAGGSGPKPISVGEIPADVNAKLTAVSPVPSTTIDTGALDAQTATARSALAAQSTDQRRPPINALLGTPEVATKIADALNQAQGIVVPANDSDLPVIYAFFDPLCPYCHQAYAGLTGRFTVKWMPLSVLGPRGDKLNVSLMGDVSVVHTTVDEKPVNSAPLSVDPERATRLDGIMRGHTTTPDAELSEGQRFILDENAELFRQLSKGAEELRAVPSFFIRSADGKAVWLRGYDEKTPDLMASIIAGQGG